jgi:Spy/CpxP family protein refolding chaperone
MFRSLKYVAALSLSMMVFAAPVRAADAPADGGDKPKTDGPKKPGAGDKRPAPADRLQNLADQLDLTDAQKKDAAPIILETHDAIEKLMADKSIAKEERRPKMQEAVKAGIDKLTALLTPEQKEKLAKLKEEGGPRKGGDKGKGGAKAAK